jgi:hypothetical protein
MVFLLVLSAICGIPPVIRLESSEHELAREWWVTAQRAIKFGIGNQRLELLHEERGCLIEVVRIECRGTVRPVANSVSTPQAAGVWSKNRVLEVIKNHAKAWRLLSCLLIR